MKTGDSPLLAPVIIATISFAARPARGACAVATMLGCYADPNGARILTGWHD
jgi:hypothetical protein